MASQRYVSHAVPPATICFSGGSLRTPKLPKCHRIHLEVPKERARAWQIKRPFSKLIQKHRPPVASHSFLLLFLFSPPPFCSLQFAAMAPPSLPETLTREQYVYMTKLAEQAERYDEMAAFMEKLVLSSTPAVQLSVEERNLLSVAYKNVIGALRAAWRIVSSIEQKEEGRQNDDHVSLVKDYRSTVESELSDVCANILKLLDSHLIPSASATESKVFYLKMKGDYHRYLAEFKFGDEKKEAAEFTMLAYKAGQVLLDFPLSLSIIFQSIILELRTIVEGKKFQLNRGYATRKQSWNTSLISFAVCLSDEQNRSRIYFCLHF